MKTEHHSDVDATTIASKYNSPCVSLLARVIEPMYRNPPDNKGPEFRDGRPLDAEGLLVYLEGFNEVRAGIAKMDSVMDGHSRRALPHILDTLDQREIDEACNALNVIRLSSPTRLSPVTTETALLPRWVAKLGGYLLFATGHGPTFKSHDGNRTMHRALVADALQITGWSYSDEHVDAVCRVVEDRLRYVSPRHCGLGWNNAEWAEAKAWRMSRGE